jgi:hypothetical protein
MPAPPRQEPPVRRGGLSAADVLAAAQREIQALRRVVEDLETRVARLEGATK